MQTLDITIDLETCSLQPTAAIMQIAAVAWDREGETLFLEDEHGNVHEFDECIRLDDQVMLNRTFDEGTIDWWSKANADAQDVILENVQIMTADCLSMFFKWIENLKIEYGAKQICLWSQGTDFDIAILKSQLYAVNKNLAREDRLSLPTYKNFRDARTYIQEVGAVKFGIGRDKAAADPRAVYKKLPKEPFTGNAHDALYDCKRTTFAVKTIMNMPENETSRELLGTVAVNETRGAEPEEQ